MIENFLKYACLAALFFGAAVSGAEKPKVAGFPMLSFRMLAPRLSMRSASSITGPRMSYRT